MTGAANLRAWRGRSAIPTLDEAQFAIAKGLHIDRSRQAIAAGVAVLAWKRLRCCNEDPMCRAANVRCIASTAFFRHDD